MATALPPVGDPDTLYVVDLSSYVLRAYHAIAPLTGPSGQPTHATYGTVTMLERLVRERRPQFVAIAMDSGRDTFRKAIFDGYKANRPPAPEDLKVQFGQCEQIVRAFAIPTFKQAGVEADDLIATVAKQATARGMKVVVVGADKDLMQLVSDRVVLWDTMRDRVFGVPEVEERYGVRVDQLRDLLALMGDSSDNVPGVPHVGPKTAKDLLTEFETLEGVYAHVGNISKKKLKENLETHHDQALLSQRLVTLKDDCDIELDFEALRYGGRDVEALRELYTSFGFRRQLAELPGKGQPAPAAAAPPPAAAPQRLDYATVFDAAALERLVTELQTADGVGLWVEAIEPSRPYQGLAGIAFSIAPGVARYVPLGHRSLEGPRCLPLGQVAQLLGPWLADAEAKKHCHGQKQSEVALAWHDLALSGVTFDTEVAHYLVDPEGSHRVEDLAQPEARMALQPRDALTKPARGRHYAFDEVPASAASEYCAARADAVQRLTPRLRSRLDELSLNEVYETLERPLSHVLAKMELRGVLVDTARLGQLGTRCEGMLQELEAKAHAAAGKSFNVNSPRQLETLLFDELGLKPLKRTKTARSTDAATLDALSEEHPLPGVILEIRQVAKLKSTYIDSLPTLVNPKTGRIHSSWEQTVAATGRLSSTDPNLQNIPIRSELGREIRAAFVAPPGHRIVSADYSQIELRVLAHLSEDPVLLDAFRQGQDIHTRTAMEIFGVSSDAITAEHRRRAKAVNFGVIYGQGESGLSKSLGIPRKEAASFITAYFDRYQGVHAFMERTLAGARQSDSVQTLFGRRRLVPDIRSGNRARRLAAERIAMNAPIQGTAADLLKLAMIALAEPVTPGAKMVLTVHDELVFEVPDGEVLQAKERVKRAMEQVWALAVPLVVDVGDGANWNEAH
ncbi:MAG: DNA polymerase I [Polyangiaceae bacterium]